MEINEKTQVLIEMLPYIKKYHNKTVVIKFGGNAMSEVNNVVEDIVLLKHIGIKPIVVHGGGPDIDSELRKISREPKFVNGLRYTDEATIKIAQQVFGRINEGIVGSINSHGAKSIDVSGCIKARQKSGELGLVGDITGIDKKKISKLIASGIIPVISPLGVSNDGKVYNLNADTAAAHIAVAVKAEKLTILTNVDGVMIKNNLAPHINFTTARDEIKNGEISKGMIPKVEACIYAVKNKCPKAHLINGLIPHSLLLEIFTDKGIGTEFVYR